MPGVLFIQPLPFLTSPIQTPPPLPPPPPAGDPLVMIPLLGILLGLWGLCMHADHHYFACA